ncbi:hypothetical protein G6N74_07840 [Mesorhizobium sp. CGMCC 1.15528]|uniref:Porin n=1 Tax=Mesorhizobium zhangyense TaxID=1776730 RepID=A0A7C9VB99_9HYPH|nr:hypothetical protein [Mesorhizobium zhangyense]NGN40972.1 hypothetical protein [Mesorhizobium zhangyense]
MRVKRASLMLALLATPSAAADLAPAAPTAPPAPKIVTSVERHWTSNALDSEFAIPDWYSLIRGSLQHEWQIDDGTVKFGAEIQATRYDTVKIEDDRAGALLLDVTKRVSPALELRGTLTYRLSTEGDDFTIGPFIIGTRAPKQVFGAQGQAGIDLGGGTALILELANAYELLGESRFQDDVLPRTKLDPDKNRTQVGAKLMRTVGQAAYGVSSSAQFVSVEKLGSPPVGLSLAEYTLQAEAGYKRQTGASITGALGVQMLRGAQDIYQSVRPTWRVAVAQPLPHGFELRGAYFGRFETIDSDDPLASWLQRGEIEARFLLNERLALASGAFAELKENLLYENKERAHGLYGEASFQATKAVSLVVRVDYTQRFLTVIDVEKKTVDAFIGIRTKI